MTKLFLLAFILLSSFVTLAQKKVARYYVGGKLYATHTYYMNSETSSSSYIIISNTQNYKGNYTSCASCRITNSYGVDILDFQNKNNDPLFTLMIRYIDKTNCILVFEKADHNTDKTEIYAAKEVISAK